MSDRFIEKSFLYLLVLSLALHAGLFALLYYLPEARPQPKEPVFMDLQDLPQPKALSPELQQKTPRRSEQRRRVLRETAPRGDAARDSFGPAARQQSRPPQARTEQRPKEAGAASGGEARSSRPEMPMPAKPQESQPQADSGLFRPKSRSGGPGMDVSRFFPGAQRLARLEEGYRRKYESDVAVGDTRFLNSDDILFGSFLRRFETAVYGVWRYPQEAMLKGIEGVTPVRITFNRRGEITDIRLLESSGAKVLDDEVVRTLRAIGPVGALPKNYDKEEFHLIAFFQYGSARRSLK
jgi:protein TonB